jgi:AcrR family transcriptional regulator
MSIPTRRERERAEREQLIVTAARELAEAEGWDAVTTRRLAAGIQYSQPVLYSHFKGKEAIMAAVAVQGFEELAGELYAARTSAPSPRDALGAVGRAYAGFCERRPALYDVMFTLTVDLPFATPEAPSPLRAAFGELRLAVTPLATGEDPGGAHRDRVGRSARPAHADAQRSAAPRAARPPAGPSDQPFLPAGHMTARKRRATTPAGPRTGSAAVRRPSCRTAPGGSADRR